MKKIFVALLSSHLAACATMAHRPTERIIVRSEPTGADAVIECSAGVRATGVTPASIGIPRHAEECVLSVAMAGMVPQTMELRRDISGKYWGALWTAAGSAAFLACIAAQNEDGLPFGVIFVLPPLAYGLISATIDAASGRRWIHEPDQIEVKLAPAK
jgi:hypothetical protein